MLLCAVCIGFYNNFRKISLKKSNEYVILVIFTTTAFLLSLMWIPTGIGIPLRFVWIFALKGFVVALMWFLTLKVLKNADLSLVTITNVFSAVLSFVLGMVIFNEKAGIWQIIGSALIILSVASINLLNKKEKGKMNFIHIIMLFVVALITASTSVIDKYTTTYLNSFQVQFWFLLFVSLFSWMFFAIECFRKRTFLIKKSDLKNYWIYIVGVCLFLGDLMLFLAYRVPNSKMITISVLSNLKVVLTVVMGLFIFKEKNVVKKIALSILVVIGTLMISFC